MADRTDQYPTREASVRSPRLNLWVSFFLFSLITMGSAIDAVSKANLTVKIAQEC